MISLNNFSSFKPSHGRSHWFNPSTAHHKYQGVTACAGPLFWLKVTIQCMVAVMVLMGCSAARESAFVVQNRSGFSRFQAGIDSLQEADGLDKTITLYNVRVRIVGAQEQFGWVGAKSPIVPIRGHANRGNHIEVIGKIVDGKIVLNQAILGHELNHLLNFRDPQVANPDKFY